MPLKLPPLPYSFPFCKPYHSPSDLPAVSASRAHSYSILGNCPTPMWAWRGTLAGTAKTWCQCPGAMFPISIGAEPDVLFLMKTKNLSSKKEAQLRLRRLMFPSLCGRSLEPLSKKKRLDDGAGHRFFWRLSSEFCVQLPDHVQHVKRLRNLGGSLQLLELTGNGGPALHIPSAGPVGESVLSFSCCLASVHDLASDTCCKSLHRKVDVFVKLGELFSSQSVVLLSFGNELVLVPFLHLCS